MFSDINLHHRHWLSQPGASGPINVTLIAGPLRLSLPICLGIVWNSYGLAFRVSKWKLLWQIKFGIWSNPVSQWQCTVGVWSLLTKQGVSEEEDLHFTTFTTKFWFSLFCTILNYFLHSKYCCDWSILVMLRVDSSTVAVKHLYNRWGPVEFFFFIRSNTKGHWLDYRAIDCGRTASF